MSFSILRNPYVLAGAGSIVLLGATIHQYSSNVAENTGFHFKDPDPTLRIVEKDVLIPKYMTNEAKIRCDDYAAKFRACVDKTKPFTKDRVMTFKTCKKENDDLLECMDGYFKDFNFYLEIKEVYLKEKTLYKACNVMTKDRNIVKDRIRNSSPIDDFTGDFLSYYKSVKSMYEKTGNMDAYDDYLIKSYNELKAQVTAESA